MSRQNVSVTKLLRYLQSQRVMLGAAGANRELIEHLNDLRLHLSGLNAEELARIFPDRPAKKGSLASHGPSNPNRNLDASSLARMDLEEIKPIIEDPETDKETLRKIAVARFGEPRGSVSKYSRNDLRVKISSYISNESGHDSIKRLVTLPAPPKLNSK
jgi:hypothetical protein